MLYELLVANLNLRAVLKNLEDLVEKDPKMKDYCAGWDKSIQFTVWGGPKAFIRFKDGTCQVGDGAMDSPDVRLFFTSPKHLNKMFEGSGKPIPVKGFSLANIRFLSNEFTALTERLEYFLKPTDELLKDPDYLALNTLFTINTAARALCELLELDPVGRSLGPGLGNGTILLKVKPDGPAAHIVLENGRGQAASGDVEEYTAAMFMKNMEVANAFLNNKLDPFLAIGLGDVAISGMTPMLDSMGLILDRIPLYLS